MARAIRRDLPTWEDLLIDPSAPRARYVPPETTRGAPGCHCGRQGLDPVRLTITSRGTYRSSGPGGGGPKRLRLLSVGHPAGVIVPTSRITLEVEGRDGTKTKFEPELPVPWPYAWTWRLARLLKVPLVRSVEPEHVRLTLPVPHRRGPAKTSSS